MLDPAVFDPALQVGKTPNERAAARRIRLVVDRRLVVDEAADRARRLAEAIRNALRGSCAAPVLQADADRLRTLAPGEGEPIRTVRLRSGVYRDDVWAGDPLPPGDSHFNCRPGRIVLAVSKLRRE